MAFFNSRMDVTHGVGGGNVHVNNQVFNATWQGYYTVDGGACGWVDDDHIAYGTRLNAVPPGWADADGLAFVVANIHTRTVTQIVQMHANHGRAGGGVWAAWFSGDPARGKPPGGMFTSVGFGDVNDYPAAVGPDGAIAYVDNPQVGGPMMVREINGDVWHLTNAALYGVQLLGERRVVAQIGQSVFTHNLTAPMVAGPTAGPKAVMLKGQPWLLSRQIDQHWRLVLHPWNSLNGYVVVDFDIYGYDIIETPTGARVVWANSEGEQAGQMVLHDIDLTTPRVDLRGVQLPIDPPIPPIEPPIQPPIPPVEPPMSIPNRLGVVQRVNHEHPALLQTNTLETCGKFTELVVLALDMEFPHEKWGHVGKNPGQTQCPCSGGGNAARAHAADAVMSKLTPATAIDIISGAHNPPHPGAPAWQEVTSGGQPWKAPLPVLGGSTEPPVTPPVPPNYEARLAALEGRVGTLEAEVSALKGEVDTLDQTALQYGTRIALRMDKGQILRANDGGGTESNKPVTFESCAGVGPHETFTIEHGQ